MTFTAGSMRFNRQVMIEMKGKRGDICVSGMIPGGGSQPGNKNHVSIISLNSFHGLNLIDQYKKNIDYNFIFHLQLAFNQFLSKQDILTIITLHKYILQANIKTGNL